MDLSKAIDMEAIENYGQVSQSYNNVGTTFYRKELHVEQRHIIVVSLHLCQKMQRKRNIESFNF